MPKRKQRIAVVSPSSNYYGSEQVLYDYLVTTGLNFDIYVPKGKFYDILRKCDRLSHNIRTYSNIQWLYVCLYFKLLLNRLDGIYINEGGHSKYLKFLGRIFPRKNFFIHIRLLEDCSASRIGDMPKNVKLIAVSEYISDTIKRETEQTSITLTDVYRIKHQITQYKARQHTHTPIVIGIVGRLTQTKGLDEIIDFCAYADSHSNHPLVISFYGDVDNTSEKVAMFQQECQSFQRIKCKFLGYVNGADNIYPNINILLHFNKQEPLGRIAFEALDFEVPFIGFKAGGIGEIAKLTGLESFMVDTDAKDFAEKFLRLIDSAVTEESYNAYQNARQIMIKICSPETYTSRLNAVLQDKCQ